MHKWHMAMAGRRMADEVVVVDNMTMLNFA
jgi:hypothetical protein